MASILFYFITTHVQASKLKPHIESGRVEIFVLLMLSVFRFTKLSILEGSALTGVLQILELLDQSGYRSNQVGYSRKYNRGIMLSG